MLLSDIGEPLNIIAEAAGISRNLLGDEIWFTSHCFRRGGAQYQFMFAPEDRRWSLKLAKWWAGYLLDDVLDREENQLGDSLALDAASCSSATLEGIPDIDYGGSQLSDDTTQDTQPTTESADRSFLTMSKEDGWLFIWLDPINITTHLHKIQAFIPVIVGAT
ncbi:hypothetical protein L917_17079 [Phytophthora nicotianae]|uniref:Uncharacterized protein n=1 Tax=Phytophthora nicotianae TaxID=4792 RepID=W2KCL4_PHYNI|nr:hypothetical protein L917_17079 [Phytophthora nicotianae]